jgi:hypothetical protein
MSDWESFDKHMEGMYGRDFNIRARSRERVTFQLPQSLHEDLKTLAFREEIPISEVVRAALKKFLR